MDKEALAFFLGIFMRPRSIMPARDPQLINKDMGGVRWRLGEEVHEAPVEK